MNTPPRRILVAEDEAMIAMMIEDYLEQLGYDLAGCFMSGAQCGELLDSGERVDAALLDCNLVDGPVWPLARKLKAAGIPFVFASGDGHGIPADLVGVPVLGKPYLIDALDKKLAALFTA
jgi:DNA-binding response OmpR family regulator